DADTRRPIAANQSHSSRAWIELVQLDSLSPVDRQLSVPCKEALSLSFIRFDRVVVGLRNIEQGPLAREQREERHVIDHVSQRLVSPNALQRIYDETGARGARAERSTAFRTETGRRRIAAATAS